MPTEQRTDHDPAELAGDLAGDREVLRAEATDPVHLPAFGDECEVVERSDNSMLVTASALDDDKRICLDCARAQASAVERRAQR